jgi:hypothetical protein
MSGFNVIHDVSNELKQQVFIALQNTPGTSFALSAGADSITLEAPQDNLADQIVLSLFLYHIDIDKHLRNQRALPDRTRDDQFRKPPLPLQLRFLVTPMDPVAETNHSLLGRIIQHFHDTPVITALGTSPLTDSFGGASAELRVKPDMLSLEQLSQIWNALSTPYRLSVAFLVDIVAIDSGRAPQQIGRVDEMSTASGLKEGQT